MPRNFKEAMLFTVLMCGMMVLGMSIWNLFLIGQLSFSHILSGYLPAFAVAFLLDVILVGPVVKFFAFKILQDHHKRWQKILTISGGMALCMATLMSIYGLVFNGVPLTWTSYGQAWLGNIIMTLPLNLIIVGPIARYVLSHIQKPFPDEDKVEDFDNDDEIPTII